MSNSNILRIAGIAGILSVVLSVAVYLTIGPTGEPSGSFFPALSAISSLAIIVFVIGLYFLYRVEAPTLSLVAVAISIVGGLLFLVGSTFMSYDFNNPVVIIADISVYIVGLVLFSWLAYQTGKMPRPLAVVGFLAGIAGLGGYVLKFGAGVDAITTPDAPLAGVASIFYYAYFLLAFGWVLWTGYMLMLRKTEMATV